MSSLFEQKLDRVTPTVYFTGAVIPLAALALLAGGSAPSLLPQLHVSWPALLLSAAGLSFASFVALRRMVRQTLAQAASDSGRVTEMLRTATELSGDHGDPQRLAGHVAQKASDLVGAQSAVVLWRDSPEAPFRVLGVGGSTDAVADGELMQRLRVGARASLACQGPLFMKKGAPSPEGGGWPSASCAFLSLGSGSGAGGSLAVLHAEEEGEFASAELEALELLSGVSSAHLQAARLLPEPCPSDPDDQSSRSASSASGSFSAA